MEAYLDNSATTQPCEQAIEAMTRSMRTGYYNPSALYTRAVDAELAMNKAKRSIADKCCCAERNVIFTSGGTESDNLAIMGHMMGQRKDGVILYSAAEHPAVKNACIEAAALYQQIAKEIPLNARGSVDLLALENMLDSRVRLICVMQVNNETGIIMPLQKIVRLRDRLAPDAAIHVDGVQGFLRVPFSMNELHIQSYAISAHKIHGPKGVGALVVEDGYRLRPLVVGGGQQKNVRSGTENTVGIEGMRAAIDQYPHYAYTSALMFTMKNRMVKELRAAIPQMQIIGPDVEDSDAASHILCVAFPPVRAETMVHALEADDVMVGTGSACSSKKGKHSQTLTAMGVDPALMDCAIRISLSPRTTQQEIGYAIEKIIDKYRTLSRYRRR